jgi:hypothetical protein
MGGEWGAPQVCDPCGHVEETPAAIARGTALHTACENYIKHGGKVQKDLKSVEKLLKLLRRDYRKGLTTIEEDMVFQPGWVPCGKFTKGAWLRTKLDVLTIDESGEVAEVIDWKSGGIDKKSGEIRPNPAYDAQLSIYCTAVMSAYPKVRHVTAILAFIDGPPGRNEVVSGGLAERRDLPRLQAKWANVAGTMLRDKIFAPNPTFICRFCAFSANKGGPCKF